MIKLSTEFTRDAVRDRRVGRAGSSRRRCTHHVHPVAVDRKRELLTHVLTQEAPNQALVFCKTKRGSDRVGEHLERAGVKAAVIHGNKSQGARTRALDDFKAGRVTVLVATDIAARGLDIAQLPLVVNYDLPLVAEDYIHRVGRTGRAGRSGRAVSLVSGADSGLLRDVQRLLSAPLEQVVVQGFDVGTRGPVGTRAAAAAIACPVRGAVRTSRTSGAEQGHSTGLGEATRHLRHFPLRDLALSDDGRFVRSVHPRLTAAHQLRRAQRREHDELKSAHGRRTVNHGAHAALIVDGIGNNRHAPSQGRLW